MNPEPVAAARALLPAWVIWFPALAAVWTGIAATLAVGLPVLIAARPLRRLSADAHWTERARASWPARRVASAGVLAAGLTGALAWTGGPLSRPLGAASGAVGVASAVAAALAVAFAVENRLVRRLPLARRATGVVTSLLVVLPAYVLALLSPAFTRGASGPWVAAGFALAVVALQAGGGLALGRALGLVRPAPERVRAALGDACAGRPGPLPAAWELPLVAANALAFPLRNAIGVTPALLAILDEAELEGVLRHEVAHLDEPLAVKLVRFGAGLAVPAGIIGAGAAGLTTWTWAALYLAGAVLAAVLTLRLGRRMEERADRVAAPASGAAYARALERLSAHNLAPAALHRCATHPDLFDRMAAAGAADPARPPRPHRGGPGDERDHAARPRRAQRRRGPRERAPRRRRPPGSAHAVVAELLGDAGGQLRGRGDPPRGGGRPRPRGRCARHPRGPVERRLGALRSGAGRARARRARRRRRSGGRRGAGDGRRLPAAPLTRAVQPSSRRAREGARRNFRGGNRRGATG
jgi:Zn-dependent protease with chaperone function